MPEAVHSRINVLMDRQGVMRRRDFVCALSLGGAALSFTDWMALQAAEIRRQGKACVLLWMQGGPSQFETFSPQPGHANGGETKAISSAVPGIEISENLPALAKRMQDLCVIRSVTSREGNHPRATHLMHTSYLPTAGLKHPSIGAIAAKECGDPAFDLPGYVRIGDANGRGAGGAGFLGVAYEPFVVQDASRAPSNTSLPVSDSRFRRRLGLLSRLETEYASQAGKQDVEDHRQLYDKATRLVLSPKMDAFDLAKEPDRVREAYGRSPFANGCLLARRLVEAGVTFVEVSLGNWDTHQDNFDRSGELCKQVDQPFAALLDDLRQRGMFDNTLVVWMGEFGRTPTINPRAGRDHFPKAFNVALAGGGIRGGQVIGKTTPGGDDVENRPVGVGDLLSTICRSLKIDANKENMSNVGRPIRIVDNGKPVDEAFG